MQEEWIRRIDEYLDHDLSEEDRNAFEARVSVDQDLREELERMEAMRKMLRMEKLKVLHAELRGIDKGMVKNEEVIDWLDSEDGEVPDIWDEKTQVLAKEYSMLLAGLKTAERGQLLQRVRLWDRSLPKVTEQERRTKLLSLTQRRWMAVAAGVAILVSAVVFWPRKPWYEKLAIEHFVDFPDDGAKRATGLTGYEELRQKAGERFNSGSYHEAENYYNQILSEYPGRFDKAKAFLGVIAFHQGHYQTSENLLKSFALNKSSIAEDRMNYLWLYALSLLAQGKSMEFRDLIDDSYMDIQMIVSGDVVRKVISECEHKQVK